MSVWDNQQATSSWFAGILEAEGSAYGEDSKYQIGITNTDIDIIDACRSYLDERCIFYSFSEQKHKNPNWKKCYQIQIGGKNNCYTLIKTLGSRFQCRTQEFLIKLKLGAPTTTCDIPLKADVYWLIGFFEGEGSFNILRRNHVYDPVIAICNTRAQLLEKFALTLKQLSCQWCSYTGSVIRDKWQKIDSIRITGYRRCQRFLRKTRGLWISGRSVERAGLLLEFCDLRLTMKRSEPYSERHHQICREMRVMI